ncbi:TRAP dicarboxylate transporter, DctP subunit [uncultured spirochete]|jgi:tripartite ATP-independent transporter DctP family solute receptor|uniref:TRAP dicarboxylate transporter, DctP subunit n=1 Tax=uncultured spirochete TaxID=156406 RepID=A0A3P3XKA9_9SPIR|nr:TRAP transporter substrate-binding protein [Rectinema subterraneum]SLM14598.1 TRAP dicarboxylate transporter, DctP subunit [uncultured spirochete]HCX95911.1 C4-dicarboxylate ABC transporter substrate-binding protein [Spirochaetaceae bacterium]
MKRVLAVAMLMAMVGVPLFAIDIKLAHVVNEQDAFHLAATKFKELTEKYTNGEVKVTIFPNAVLGDERTLLERMKMGIVDAGVITSGPFVNFVPKFGVVDMPFLFRDAEHAYKVLDGPIGDKLFADLEPQGWKGLAWAERGFRNLTNNKRPINKPEDVAGLKIRLMQNPIYVDSFKALGANAVPMAWTEALTALQQHTIDGQENPLNVIVSFKLYESQKYLAITRHAYAPAPIIMSMMTWKKLTPAQQTAVLKAAREAAQYERDYDNQNEAGWLKELADKGMVITRPDLSAFLKAVKPVYDTYSDKFGKDLINAILETK